MKLSTGKTDDIFVLTLAGSIRADDNDKLQAALCGDEIRQSRAVIVDISQLEYLNSRAIGTLMALWMELKPNGALIQMVNPTPLVEKLLKSVGMYSLIPVAASLEEAVRAAGKNEG